MNHRRRRHRCSFSLLPFIANFFPHFVSSLVSCDANIKQTNTAFMWVSYFFFLFCHSLPGFKVYAAAATSFWSRSKSCCRIRSSAYYFTIEVNDLCFRLKDFVPAFVHTVDIVWWGNFGENVVMRVEFSVHFSPCSASFCLNQTGKMWRLGKTALICNIIMLYICGMVMYGQTECVEFTYWGLLTLVILVLFFLNLFYSLVPSSTLIADDHVFVETFFNPLFANLEEPYTAPIMDATWLT